MSKPKSLPSISVAELEGHKSASSCYVTIGSKVYDITLFLGNHPGGEDLILSYAGKDIAEILVDESSHRHTDAAYEILDDYLVGFLVGSRPPSPPGTPTVTSSLTGMSSAEELSVPTDISTDYKVHKFLDLNRPLFMQVWNGGFTKEFYLQQVHRPRHYKGGESAPLFGNFLEPLSKTPWYVVPSIWLPCIAYGTYEASKGLPNNWAIAAITMHFLLHGIHHYLPMDKLRLVMPPTLFLALATPFWHLAHTIFAFNWYVGTVVFCGGIFGYVCYDLTHYFLHHKSLPSYYRELKKYHLQHHFADYQKGFGVTSKIWDKVFGTELIYGPSGPVKSE